MLDCRLALVAAAVLAACAPARLAEPAAPATVAPSLPSPVLPSTVRAPPPRANPTLDRAIADAMNGSRSDARAAADVEETAGPIPTLVRSPSAEAARETAGESDPDARLPAESIQRVVRANSGRFRSCYQHVLRRDPSASGQIVTHFVIGPDGLTQLAHEELSTFADRATRLCVQRAFFDLEFPRPPGGHSIAVIYPMRFGQGPAPVLDLPSARRAAEPPPPGFAERMRSGVPVPPEPVVMPFKDAAPPPRRSSACVAGDPMCSDL